MIVMTGKHVGPLTSTKWFDCLVTYFFSLHIMSVMVQVCVRLSKYDHCYETSHSDLMIYVVPLTSTKWLDAGPSAISQARSLGVTRDQVKARHAGVRDCRRVGIRCGVDVYFSEERILRRGTSDR